jgi:hypothetical protein
VHETGIIEDLMRRAAARTPAGARIVKLRFRRGALAAISASHLREDAADHARAVWGHEVIVEVEESDELSGPASFGITLTSIVVE